MVIIMLTKQRLGRNHPKTNPTMVSFFVRFKNLPPTKGHVTLLAPERFFTRVYSFMLSHILYLAKGLVTMPALKWLLTCVYSLVSFQISCLAKGLVTLLALKRLLTTVCSFMSFQISCLAKRLDTMLALKWLLTSMYSFMYLQISCLPKGLLTCGCGCKHLTFFFYNALEILAIYKKILYLSSDYKSITVTNSWGPGISFANTSKKIDKKHFPFVQFPQIKCIYQAK